MDITYFMQLCAEFYHLWKICDFVIVTSLFVGGVGIVNMIGKFQRHEYMGFENLCKYSG